MDLVNSFDLPHCLFWSKELVVHSMGVQMNKLRNVTLVSLA